MTSRRRVLALVAGALAGTAGCLDGGPGATPAADDDTPTTLDDGPTTTPGDLPAWTPEWTRSFDAGNVLAVDTGGDELYLTLSSEGGPSVVAAVDPSGGDELWRTESGGEAVDGSHAGDQGIARGQWGVTVAEDAVYAVAGPVEERRWTALHTLERASGDRRWSLERDRELGVAGVEDGLVVATGLEFFPGPDETPVSHQSPDEPLSTVVYGIEPDDGTVRWDRTFSGVADVATAADRVHVAAGDRLVGLDHDGETAFTYDQGPPVQVEAVEGRAYYLAGEDEAAATVHGVAPGGSADWTRDLPVAELLVDDGRLYAAGDAVLAVDPDGTVAWRDDDHGQWLLPTPGGETLYTRAGGAADRVTAYDAAGGERWTFDPPSTNAWPEAATDDAVAVTAITAEEGPFNTVYAVDADGVATAALDVETVFEAAALGGTIYLADGEGRLLALDP